MWIQIMAVKGQGWGMQKVPKSPSLFLTLFKIKSKKKCLLYLNLLKSQAFQDQHFFQSMANNTPNLFY